MSTSLRDYLWRNRWRFNSKEFAERLGIDPTHLSKIANGSHVPSIALAKKIEAATDFEVKWHELIDFCFESKQSKKKICKKST